MYEFSLFVIIFFIFRTVLGEIIIQHFFQVVGRALLVRLGVEELLLKTFKSRNGLELGSNFGLSLVHSACFLKGLGWSEDFLVRCNLRRYELSIRYR